MLFGRKRRRKGHFQASLAKDAVFFENICREDKELFLEDGATEILLNADSQMDVVSKVIKSFLDYVAGKESEDSFVKKLEESSHPEPILKDYKMEAPQEN